VVVQFLPGTALPSPDRKSSRELLSPVVGKRSIGYLVPRLGEGVATYALPSCLRMHTWLCENSRWGLGVLSMKIGLDIEEGEIERTMKGAR